MRIAAERLTKVSALVEKEVRGRNIPGAVVAVGHGEHLLYSSSFGYAENRDDVVRFMTTETIFDLASLTKVTATLPAILLLIDDGEICLEDPLALFFPEFAQGRKQAITIRHLLTHSAGLPASRPYYKLLSDSASIAREVRREALVGEPGQQTEYSDLGFMLLGQLVQIVAGQPLDRFTEKNIFAPLGMAHTFFRPPAALASKIAATEHAEVGIVHDGNARALGGVSGHAGLFSTMSDLISYVEMWLGYRPLLSFAVRSAATQNQTPLLNGKRGLGWVCRFDRHDCSGDLWPNTTVNHTGFTGTSLTFDPVSQLWTIILTNAVHYGREKPTVRLRARLHNLIASAVEPD